MDALELIKGPVGRTLLESLHTDRLDHPGALQMIEEGKLLQLVVSAALRVTSEGLEAAMRLNVRQPSRGEVALAEQLLDCPAARWWTAPWNTRAQIWTCPKGSGPPTQRVSPSAPHKPRVVLWTSSRVARIGSAWMPVATSGVVVLPRVQESWQVEIEPRLPIVEVHTAADWGKLCNSAPVHNIDGLIEPDWTAVADRSDGVHLSVAGLIAAQGLPVRGTHGVGMMWGWGTESTAWLNWHVNSCTTGCQAVHEGC